MFDFEKLKVYQAAKSLNKDVNRCIKLHSSINSVVRNQLRRASLSIVLNIAEGAGKLSPANQKNFYFMARGSAHECVAIFDILKDNQIISKEIFDIFYIRYEEISKMLFGLAKSLRA